jgi:hypothetical protein
MSIEYEHSPTNSIGHTNIMVTLQISFLASPAGGVKLVLSIYPLLKILRISFLRIHGVMLQQIDAVKLSN